jgi:hypothetical protein
MGPWPRQREPHRREKLALGECGRQGQNPHGPVAPADDCDIRAGFDNHQLWPSTRHYCHVRRLANEEAGPLQRRSRGEPRRGVRPDNVDFDHWPTVSPEAIPRSGLLPTQNGVD